MTGRNTSTLEAENELLQFLKLTRPEWSKPRRHGRSDAVKVMHKLGTIGVSSITSLMQRIDNNSLNADLFALGFVPLCKETLDSIRKRRQFLQALEFADVPHVRQVGELSPVKQLLSQRLLLGDHRRKDPRPLDSSRCIVSSAPPPLSSCRSVPSLTWTSEPLDDERIVLPRITTAGELIHKEVHLRGLRPTRQKLSPLLEALSPGSSLEVSSKLPSRSLDLSTASDDEEEAELPGKARWHCRTSKHPHQLGQEMLNEQASVAAQAKLMKSIRKRGLFCQVPPSGDADPFRSYVAHNIQLRLQEEAKREQLDRTAVSQRCINIRKELASLGNARRELSSLRAKVQSLTEAPETANASSH